MGFLIDVDADLSIVVSLMRTERKFGKAEFRVLTEVQPVVDALCRRHWSNAARTRPDDAAALLEQICL